MRELQKIQTFGCQLNCYAKGSGKEGQAPWMKKTDKRPDAVVGAVDNKEGALFAFTCTSDYAAMAYQNPSWQHA